MEESRGFRARLHRIVLNESDLFQKHNEIFVECVMEFYININVWLKLCVVLKIDHENNIRTMTNDVINNVTPADCEQNIPEDSTYGFQRFNADDVVFNCYQCTDSTCGSAMLFSSGCYDLVREIRDKIKEYRENRMEDSEIMQKIKEEYKPTYEFGKHIDA